MDPNSRRGLVALIVAAAVAAVGLIIVIVSMFGASAAASFGWFAYAPLADAAFLPSDIVVLSRYTLIGAVLLVLGLLALSFLFGMRTGGRPRSDGPRP